LNLPLAAVLLRMLAKYLGVDEPRKPVFDAEKVTG
jgi:hypothetical protein